jgi:hypothetical protein
VVEALQPMSDEIDIIDIKIEKTENNAMQVNVDFTPVLTDPDVPTINSDAAPEIDAISVTIPQD